MVITSSSVAEGVCTSWANSPPPTSAINPTIQANLLTLTANHPLGFSTYVIMPQKISR